MRKFNHNYLNFIIFLFILFVYQSKALAVCGDGVIDVDATGTPTEACDLGTNNNNDPNSLSGCDTNCKTKLGGWTCTNTLSAWTNLAQTSNRSLKNLFISLVQRNKNNTITATNCTPTTGIQACQDYINDIYEFKRLNVNNSINNSANLRCIYAGDNKETPDNPMTLIDPAAGTPYTVNCGTDIQSNGKVPTP